jgi:hypothetical protein
LNLRTCILYILYILYCTVLADIVQLRDLAEGSTN